MRQLCKGNVAAMKGAILAGCRAYYGYPITPASEIAEAATLDAPVYIERVAVSDNKNIMKARRAIRKALELQRDGVGFSFVEILSPCPTIWGMNPVPARKWIAEQMIPVFPLQVFRDRKPEPLAEAAPPQRSMRQFEDELQSTQGDGSLVTA